MENSFKEELQKNKNSNGGGLATNLTGKFESNRHAIAKLEKYTFGEVVAELKKKKNGGFVISASQLLEIYTALFGTPEWHHAGKLPKQYGGGMKKTYFLKEIPTAEQVNEWLKQFENLMIEKKKLEILRIEKEKKQMAFLNKFATPFNRLSEKPKFSIITGEEMNGKYGWFVADLFKYNLPVYYSGYAFKSQKSLDKYRNIE